MKWVRGGRLLVATAVVALLAGCSAQSDSPAGPAADTDSTTQAQGQNMKPVTTSERDWADVADELGRAGELSNETVYRVSFPRKDLDVTSKGVDIKAGLALGSYAAFARYPDDTTTAMGDLVVTEQELPKVTDTLQKRGIEQTAVHKHLLAHEPPVWWVHFHAEGADSAKIAQGVKAALDVTATPPADKQTQQEPIDLDTSAIDEAMGTQGKNDGGIYKFSFARTDTVTAHNKVLPTAIGVSTAINFQPTGGGKAAINGDFAMTADEVQGVVQALRAGGIDVVALHNHALDDQPHLFYMHFWANDDAVKLAKTLNKAVNQHDVTPAG